MEYLDILSSDGKELGISKPRDQVHQDGDWHRAVDIWILNSNRQLLMQKRSFSKESYAGYWDISCAGHVKSGQTSVQAAIAELQEELGLSIQETQLKFLFSIPYQYVIHNGKFINNEWNDVYLLTMDLSIHDLKLDFNEVLLVQWFEIEKLKCLNNDPTFRNVPHDLEYQKLFELLG